MKKKIIPVISVLTLSLVTPLAVSTTSISEVKAEEVVNDQVTLRVKNMGDYIYVHEEDGDAPDLIHQFESWMKENTKYKNVKVAYETTDTNETLLTELQTGKAAYDLICPSDYMIQKMIREDLIEKLDASYRDEVLSDYDTYASTYVRSQLDNITSTDVNGNTVTLGEYAVGYMWGTLGLLFNPTYGNYDTAQLIKDMESWEVLWNSDYAGTISIKDSMRDTYAAVLMRVYKDELNQYRSWYLAGVDDEGNAYTSTDYTASIQSVFDRVSDDDIKLVKENLDDLKGNIFGLEVDSGKMDIVQERIGINLAWSGDAVYSMELGSDNDIDLLYSIPLEGSNIWFDGWVMPKVARSEAQREVAYYFLNFISMPENAAQNMDYTGYSSFIGGDDILSLVQEWYDIRYSIAEEENIDISEVSIDPSWEQVDLNYIFNPDFGTSIYVQNTDYIFYTDEYFYSLTDDSGESYSNLAVGGDFFCQYPDFETLVRCAVMKDYGKQNEAVVAMWEKFKTSSMPTWAIILLAIEVALMAGLFLFFVISKHLKLKLRAKRKAEKQK